MTQPGGSNTHQSLHDRFRECQQAAWDGGCDPETTAGRRFTELLGAIERESYAYLEIKLSVRDAIGREMFYTTRYELALAIPPSGATTGWQMQTGITDADHAGIRGMVELRRAG